MTEYLTEEEQLQHLKQLARQYVPAILVGLVLAFALTSGWRAWQERQDRIRVLASTGFEEMLTAASANKTAAVTEDANILVNQYPKTVYASQAALMLAREAVHAGHLEKAAGYLETVIQRGQKTGLYSIALLRLARLRLANGNPAEALRLLDTVTDPAYAGLQNAIRGDALLASHQRTDAANAWQLALKQLPETGMLKSLVQMKYDALASSSSGNSR